MAAKRIDKNDVVRLRKEHPDWTLERLGNEVGVTRERIRQILKQFDLPTRGYKRFYAGFNECPKCLGPKRDYRIVCITCHREKYPQTYLLTCVNKKCGREFERGGAQHRASIKRYPNAGKMTFCSKRCQGEYIGKHFGWGAHRKTGTNWRERQKPLYVTILDRIRRLPRRLPTPF